MSARIPLSALPAKYQAQASVQLVGMSAREGLALLAKMEAGDAKVPKRKRGPNKTEQAFRYWYFDDAADVRFEPFTFHMLGRSKYRPDWVIFNGDGSMTCYEVKGSYRLPSHGRALTAFKECRAQFPQFRFHWFEKQKDGSFIEKYILD